MKNEVAILEGLTFRPIHPDEAEDVVRLHREAIADEEIATSIYSSPHIAEYLRHLMTSPQLRLEHHFVGAWSNDALVGYAHFRALPSSWHLNQIAVSPAYQGYGIGSHLWEMWIKEGGERNYSLGSLDVRQENSHALAWYLRKGLQIINRTYILEKNLPLSCREDYKLSDFEVLNWNEAEVQHTSVGFSSLLLLVNGMTFQVGRLGAHYFRTDYEPPLQVQAFLAELDPGRRLLLFSDRPLDGYSQIGIMLRMHLVLPTA